MFARQILVELAGIIFEVKRYQNKLKSHDMLQDIHDKIYSVNYDASQSKKTDKVEIGNHSQYKTMKNP